ncbi:MAG: hypothetical protein KKA42_11970, partial [candidate division Zixibacteria bacterium]|nr:hypothetical protein [candidate division Zixibacteria bacterium]
MNTNGITAVLLCVVSALTLQACCAKPLMLRMGYQPGDQFHERTSKTMRTEAPGLGAMFGMNSSTINETAVTVDSVLGDTMFYISRTIESVRASGTGPTGTYDYDSRALRDDLSIVEETFADLIGRTMTSAVTARAATMGFASDEKPQPPSNMFSGSFSLDPSSSPSAGSLPGAESASTAPRFPLEAVKIGEQWIVRDSGSAGMTIVTETTYALRSRDNDVAVVDFTGTGEIDYGEYVKDLMPGSEITIESSLEFEG